MKVEIYLTQGKLTIENMSAEGAMSMIEEFQSGASTLQFTLDEDGDMTYVNTLHIVRIDMGDADEPAADD